MIVVVVVLVLVLVRVQLQVMVGSLASFLSLLCFILSCGRASCEFTASWCVCRVSRVACVVSRVVSALERQAGQASASLMSV